MSASNPHEQLRAVALTGAERNFATTGNVVGVALVLRPGELRSVVSNRYDNVGAWQEAIRRAVSPDTVAVAIVFEAWRASAQAVLEHGFEPRNAPGRTEIVTVLVESPGKRECLTCEIKREGARANLAPWAPMPGDLVGGFGNYFPNLKGAN